MSHNILIGVDEAGYGPNLGPLVISGSVWRLGPTPPIDGTHLNRSCSLSKEETTDWFVDGWTRELIAKGVFSDLQKEVDNEKAVLLVGDSKRVYKSGDSLERLGRTVLTVYHYLGKKLARKTKEQSTDYRLSDFQWTGREAEKNGQFRLFRDWENDFQQPVPVLGWCQSMKPDQPAHSRAGERHTSNKSGQRNDRGLANQKMSLTDTLPEMLASALNRANADILDLRSSVIYPEQFNDSVDRFGSKGTAHAHFVLNLIRCLLDRLPDCPDDCPEKVWVICDKLGARNRYSGLLFEIFGETLLETVLEGAKQSEYRFIYGKRPITLRFQVKGDSLFPVALSSLASKFLRELAMQRWNEFWQAVIPHLTATAGYPEDARRFLADIATVQQNLGIPMSQFWRKK
ncbi:MAG: hypothetical protein ACRC10_05055 [Thermoguttaceae bacterium]